MKEVKAASSKDRISQEDELRNYWRDRDTDGNTAFEYVQPRGLRDTINPEIVSSISSKIFEGKPLAFDEYHIAIALNLLITELPYKKFFMTRWHENKTHMGYGPRCELCGRESKE